MLILILCFAIGESFAQLVVLSWWLIVVINVIIIITILITDKLFKQTKNVILLATMLCLGMIYGKYQAQNLLNQQLPSVLIGKNLQIDGYITAIPVKKNLGVRFQFKTISINSQRSVHSLILNWYRQAPYLHVGDRWQLNVRVKPAHGLYNFGNFDYQRWLWEQGIVLTGYVLDKKSNQLIEQKPQLFLITHWRESIQQLIMKSISSTIFADMISALAIGNQNAIQQNEWQVLQQTGTGHLWAISGSNVGLVAVIAYFCFAWLWRQIPLGLVYLPAPRIGAAAAMIVTLCYGALAGFSIPTQRAVIMVMVLMLAQLISRSTPIWHRLLLSAGIIIILDPLACLSASFWLSYAAVIWIHYSLLGVWRCKKSFLQWLRIQWVITLGLLPFNFYFFQQCSLVAFLANALAIPWVGVVLIPMCLLACLCLFFSSALAAIIFATAAYLLSPLWMILKWLASLRFAQWQHAVDQPMVLLIGLMAAALCAAPKGWPGRWLGCLGILPLIFYQAPAPGIGEIWLTVFDVGQGLATLLQTQHHTLIYDTGPSFPQGFNAGRDVILPYLRKMGQSHLNLMVISHGDNDHSGGAQALLSTTQVDHILSSAPLQFANHSLLTCHTGQQWIWDGFIFRILAPDAKQIYQKNNSSCVLQIIAKASHDSLILLVGDIEASAEAKLVTHYSKKLRTLVLVVPHHGSRTSSSAKFVAAVHPQYVIFPLGFLNRYHFPAPSVLARYQLIGAKIFSTAKDGAVSMRINSKQIAKIMVANPHIFYWQ